MKKHIGGTAMRVSACVAGIAILAVLANCGCGQPTANSNLTVNPGDQVANFAVSGMTTDACSDAVEKEIEQLPGVTDARTIPAISSVQVSYDPFTFKPVTAEDIKGKYTYKVSLRYDEKVPGVPNVDNVKDEHE